MPTDAVCTLPLPLPLPTFITTLWQRADPMKRLALSLARECQAEGLLTHSHDYTHG